MSGSFQLENKGKRSITFITLHGRIDINRTILRITNDVNLDDYDLKSKEIIPFDEYLGIDKLPFKITKEMMVEMAFCGQNQASFADAEMLLGKYYNVKSNQDTILQVTEFVGKLVFNSDDNKAQEIYNNIANIDIDKPKTKDTLYVEIDGAAINTRIEDENGSTWKENKLAILFDDKDLYRRKDGSNKIISKEYVSYFGSVDEFQKHLFSCAYAHDFQSYKNVVFISDGATWIRNMINEFYPNAIQILDLFHLKENISDYAKAIFKDNDRKIKNFCERTLERIYNKEFNLIFKELKKYQDVKLPSGVVNLVSYIENNKSKMDYRLYESKGWFVGSGAIESANKIVVQRRLKQAGMRWGVLGAQFLLSLRAKFESGLWNSLVREKVLAFC